MAEDREQKSEEKSKPKISAQAIGAGLVLVILAAYFLWMTVQMGTAAVSGSAPMLAFLGAAFVGIAAAGAALALGRKQR